MPIFVGRRWGERRGNTEIVFSKVIAPSEEREEGERGERGGGVATEKGGRDGDRMREGAKRCVWERLREKGKELERDEGDETRKRERGERRAV